MMLIGGCERVGLCVGSDESVGSVDVADDVFAKSHHHRRNWLALTAAQYITRPLRYCASSV